MRDLVNIAIAVIAASAVTAAALHPRPGKLDSAQRAFEHNAQWPAPADFEAWRKSGSLRCRDIPTLRICEATWPLSSPSDGKPFGKDHVAFACSPEVCAWVSP